MQRNESNYSQRDSILGSKLKKALHSEDFLTFKRLIKGGVDVNVKYWFQSTLLHEAVQIGNVEFVKVLLQNKADVNSVNKDNRTALHIASRGGHLGIVKLLLEHGADMNIKSRDLQTALHCAAWRMNIEVMKLLVQHGADVNVVDSDKWQPLHWAVKHGNLGMVEYFIKQGAMVDNICGKSRPNFPFATAVGNRHLDIANIMLNHGAYAGFNMEIEQRVVLNTIGESKILPRSLKIDICVQLYNAGLVWDRDQVNRQVVRTHSENLDQFIPADRVRTLSVLCRLIIRSHLSNCCDGKSIEASVQSLCLPSILKDYVLFARDHRVLPIER